MLAVGTYDREISTSVSQDKTQTREHSYGSNYHHDHMCLERTLKEER